MQKTLVHLLINEGISKMLQPVQSSFSFQKMHTNTGYKEG